MLTNILEYLENTAKRLPNKLAFSDGREGVTFSSLLNGAQSIGSHLAANGTRGRSVGVLMDKSPRQLVAFMGVVYSGGYYFALDQAMPRARIDMIIGTAAPRLIITDKRNLRLTEGLDCEVVLYEDICETEVDDSLLQSIRSSHIDTDPLYIVFTSGSTGVPKGVIACHRSVIDYTEALCEAVGFDENSVFGNQAPLYFDAPLKDIMPTLKFGATTYLIPKQLFMFPMKLCDFLNDNKINTICWVVSALTIISSLGALEKNPPKHLRTVCFGSEVFPRNQYDLWRKTLPEVEFFNLYGPTEATGMSCFWRASRTLAPDEPIPVGAPFKNTDVFLVTEDGRRAVGEEVGEITIRGTCVTMGYINNPEKTSEAFVQNPLQSAYPEIVYKTGDLGRINEHGELVFISRKDSQIKHMGHRIELGEIEAAAADCPGVGRACAVYPELAKKIVLFYIGKASPSEINAHLLKSIPRYMLPSELRRLDSMPFTENGKLNRRLMKEMAESPAEK